jgi:hypothetical protein
MNTVPAIGARVRVSTVRFGNRNMYEGIVVPSSRTFTFAVRTGNERHPVSEFEASDPAVISIEVLKGGVADKTNARVFKVRVRSTGKTYYVSSVNGKLQCNCTGFSYRKTCSHVVNVRKLS